MIYVYAVTDSPAPPPPSVTGIGGEPLLTLRSGSRLAAVYSRHAPLTCLAPTAENVVQHERAVEGLTPDRTVLPARFGTTFPDVCGLEAALSDRAVALVERLDHVRGCVEMGLRVAWRPPIGPSAAVQDSATATAAGSGRAYMLAKLAAERQSQMAQDAADRIGGSLHAALAVLARDSSHRFLPAPGFLMVAAYLVPVDQAGAFGQQVRQLAVDQPALRLLCTGPWPPYHFASPLGPAEVRHA